jgi:UDP-N-acetyl-D-galactosamine dehydrogenase
MGGYIATEVVKRIIRAGKNVLNSRVLVMGATFKENVSDIRNSRVADVVDGLKSYGIRVEIVDPYASSDELQEEYGFSLIPDAGKDYDAIIIAVAHNEYLNRRKISLKITCQKRGVVMDVKEIYRNKLRISLI